MAITASAAGGNWNANASWVGSVQPGAGDDVVIDATSAGITIPTGTTVACLSLNMTAGKLTYATTTAILNINAGFTASVGSTLTLTGVGQMNFVSTSSNGGTGWSVTSGGKTLPTVNFSGAGGKWVLQDAFNVSTRTLTFTQGTLDTNGKAITAGALSSSNSNTRTLTLGASTLTLSSTGIPVTMPNNTGLTLSAASSTVACTGAGCAFSTTTAETWGTVTHAASGDFLLTSGLTCGTFTRTGTASKTDSLTLGGTLTVSGVFTANGNSITNRLYISGGTISAGTVTTSNTDWFSITGAGSGSWNLAAITGKSGDAGSNSGITFTTPAAQSTSTAALTWSTGTWTTRVPLPQDDVTVTSATSIAFDMPRLGKNVTISGNGNVTGASIVCSVYGSLLFSGLGTLSVASGGVFVNGSLTLGTNMTSVAGSGTTAVGMTLTGNTFTTRGASFTGPIVTGNCTLIGALTTAAAFSPGGNFNDGGYNVTALDSFGTGTVTSSGAWTLTDATSGALFTTAAFTGSDASSITISSTSASTRSVTAGGITFGTLNLTVAGSTGQLSITGSNSFFAINFSDASNARTLAFTSASAINTIREGDFNVRGTSGKLMTISPGTSGKLSRSGGAISVDFVSLTSSTAQGGAVWFAGANSTNGGSNSGWTFSAPTGNVVSAAGGNWSANTAWFGGAAPTASSPIYALAGTRSGALTLDTTGNCRSLDLYGYQRTFALGTQALNVGDASGGAVFISSLNTLTFTSAVLTLKATAGSYTVTTSATVMPTTTVNGSGGTWTCADAYSIGSSNTFTMTAGTFTVVVGAGLTCGVLNIGGGTITTGGTCAGAATMTGGSLAGGLTANTFATTGASAKTITASIFVTASSTTVISFTTTNPTLTGSTFTTTGSDVTIVGNPTWGVLHLLGSGDAILNGFQGSQFQRIPSPATVNDALTLSGGITIGSSFGQQISLNGGGTDKRLLIRSNVLGTARGLTSSQPLGVSATYNFCDFQDITTGGTQSWSLTTSGDCGGNTGFTFSSPTNRYAVVAGSWASTATWATSTGGAGGASVPLVHDTAVLDGSSGAGTYTIDMPRIAGITATGFTRTLTDSLAWSTFGNLTLAAGMTWSASNAITFAARSSATLTSAGKTLAGALTLAAPSGTITLQDALLCSSSLTITNGTFVDNAQNVSVASFVSTGITTRALTATGAWSLTSTAASTIFGLATTGNTVSASSGTFTISNVTSNARIFAGGGSSYGSLIYTVAGSTGMLTVTGSNTLDTLSFSDVTNARTLTLTAGTTTTIGTLFDVNGTSGKLMSLVSSSGGVAATVSKSSGTVTCQFLSIQDSTATGGATWQANGSTDVSGNTGWSFGGTAYTSTITNLLGLLDAESSALSRYLTDALNGLDAATPVGVFARSKTDLSGLLDAAAQAATSARSQTDLLGMLDAATRLVTGARSQTDLEGLLDSTTQQGTWLRTVLDSLGGLDAATPTFAFGRSQGDLIGLLDTATRVVAGARSQTDLEGLLDSVSQAQDWVRTSTNTLGGLDAATGLLEFLYSVTDLSGLSDAASRVYTAARSQTDVDGLLDSNTSVSSAVRTATEAIGLLDSQIKALEHLVTDVLGGVDSRTLALGHSVTDVLGALDSSTALLISSVLITDILGATDTAVILGTFLRSLTNSEGLQDTRAAVSGFTRALTNTLGAVDAMTFMRLIVVWLSLKITTTVQDRKLTTSVQDRPITTTVEDRPIATASHNVSTSGEEI